MFYDIKDNFKMNLLLAVTHSKVIYYKLSSENTDANNFLSFMKELVDQLSEKEIEKYIFFIYNCTIHLTTELFQFYRGKN